MHRFWSPWMAATCRQGR